jgi:hypothetical protein
VLSGGFRPPTSANQDAELAGARQHVDGDGQYRSRFTLSASDPEPMIRMLMFAAARQPQV